MLSVLNVSKYVKPRETWGREQWGFRHSLPQDGVPQYPPASLPPSESFLHSHPRHCEHPAPSCLPFPTAGHVCRLGVAPWRGGDRVLARSSP